MRFTVGLDNGNGGFPGSHAGATAAATASDDGAVVFVTAQQNGAAIKSNAVAVTARLMVNHIRRIGQHIGVRAAVGDGKLHGKAVRSWIKAGNFQRLAGSVCCISGFLISTCCCCSSQGCLVEKQRVSVQLEPFVQRVNKRGIFREGKVVWVDQHLILDQLLPAVCRTAFDKAVIGKALLDVVGNLRKLNSVRLAVHAYGVLHHNRLITAEA